MSECFREVFIILIPTTTATTATIADMSSIDHSQSRPRIMASGSGASEPIPGDAGGYKRHSVLDLLSLKGRVTVVTGTYTSETPILRNLHI